MKSTPGDHALAIVNNADGLPMDRASLRSLRA
jgi:hypothetical protein